MVNFISIILSLRYYNNLKETVMQI